MIWSTEELAEQWHSVPLSALTSKVGSGATPRGGRSSYPDQGTPLIRSQNVHFDGFTSEGLAFLTDEQAKQLDGVRVKAGDVLLNITGASIGRVCVAPAEMDGARVNQHVCIIRATEIDSEFLAHYLASPQVQDAIALGNYGVTREALTKSQILELPVPVPESGEQRVVAAAISGVKNHRRSATGHLDSARHAIERFRQSVLAAACSGRLTADWRDSRGLGEWDSKRAEDICNKVQSGSTPKVWHTEDGGIPFLKVYNIVDQRLDFDYRPQYISPELFRGPYKRTEALPGDVLMNIVGPPLGKVAVVTGHYAAWSINQALTLFRPSERISTEWLYIFLCSGISVDEVMNDTKGTVGQINISLTQCRNFMIPVPTLEEQAEIARRVGELFKMADAVAQRISQASKRVERSSHAVLAKAFRGELIIPGAAA